MFRTKAAALLLATTILGGAAQAQTAATPSPMATTGGKFVTDQGTTEFRASKFVGIDVYGSDNEKIGDISEILIDGQGNAKAIVIGVGGFLGIGQKNVAIPWSALTWSNDRPPTRTASTGSTGAGSMGTGATGNTGASAPTVASAPMTGGTPPATSAAPSRSPAEQAAYNGYPDHARVILTKAELQEAPAFKYYADSHSSTGAATTPPPPASTSRP
ncbi:PRC-barrel domain-containing protein [uncultured Enterovirga sp.]|uniref:PRC-barrel domain-containing protein n=1 Tax=uncultured Enterovirga sp. TaxID=2026352 RepID=UPI0035CAB177